MKKIFLLVMLALSICCTAFASKQQVIDSFKTLIQPKIAEVEATYPPYSLDRYVIVKDGKNYHKEMVIFTSEYDIKETKSILNPYIGILKLNRTEMAFKSHKTVAEAKTEMQPDFINDSVINISIVYKYTEGSWLFDNAYHYITRRPLEISEKMAYDYVKCPDEYKEPNNHEPIIKK